MGTMGSTRQKMVIGLRLEYLSRIKVIRDGILTRLVAGENPFEVATSIKFPGRSKRINLIEDKRKTFVSALTNINAQLGSSYTADESALHEHNRDHTGNRRSIVGWWQGRPNPAQLINEMRMALIAALRRNRSIKVWWDCTLSDGRTHAVTYVEENGWPTVLFMTDNRRREFFPDGPIEDESLRNAPRLPVDP